MLLPSHSGGYLVHPPCSSRATRNHLARTTSTSTWFWSISKDRDSTTSLYNLSQRSVTLTVKKCFATFRRNFLFSDPLEKITQESEEKASSSLQCMASDSSPLLSRNTSCRKGNPHCTFSCHHNLALQHTTDSVALIFLQELAPLCVKSG